MSGAAERTGQHDVYDPTTNAWTSAPPLPTPRSGVAAALYKGMILVLGGELPPNHTFVENEAYDPTRGHWGRARAHAGGTARIRRCSNVYFVGGSLTPGGGGIMDQLIMFSLP